MNLITALNFLIDTEISPKAKEKFELHLRLYFIWTCYLRNILLFYCTKRSLYDVNTFSFFILFLIYICVFERLKNAKASSLMEWKQYNFLIKFFVTVRSDNEGMAERWKKVIKFQFVIMFRATRGCELVYQRNFRQKLTQVPTITGSNNVKFFDATAYICY